MPRLIVNADDFGQQGERDAGILELHRAGALSSASAVVNGRSVGEAIPAALDQGLALGLHLNLSEGSALTAEMGQLPGKFAARAVLARWPAEVLRREIAAQFDRFEHLAGRPPSHVDGHHHLHVASAVLPPLIAELLSRFPDPARRPALRVPHSTPELEPFAAIAERFAGDPTGLEFHSQVQREAMDAAPRLRKVALRHPAGFFGIALIGAAMTPAALSSALSRLNDLPEGIYELMCHPGFPAACGDPFVTSVERRQEFDSLLAVFGEGRAPLPLTDFSALSPCRS